MFFQIENVQALEPLKLLPTLRELYLDNNMLCSEFNESFNYCTQVKSYCPLLKTLVSIQNFHSSSSVWTRDFRTEYQCCNTWRASKSHRRTFCATSTVWTWWTASSSVTSHCSIRANVATWWKCTTRRPYSPWASSVMHTRSHRRLRELIAEKYRVECHLFRFQV